MPERLERNVPFRARQNAAKARPQRAAVLGESTRLELVVQGRRSMNRTLSRILLGAASGVVATATMTAALAGFKAVGLLGEPPPKKLTRRVLTLFGMRPSRGAPLATATLAAHVAYGAGMGAVYGVLPRPVRTVPGGALYGLAVWAISYVGWIPKLHLMRPPSRDRFGRPTSMILAHLVYGATLGADLPALERRLARSTDARALASAR